MNLLIAFGAAARDFPSPLGELLRSFPQSQACCEPVHLGRCFHGLQPAFGSGSRWQHLWAGAVDCQARVLVTAPESGGAGEGIRGAASEDCCNFMAPLAAPRPRRAKRGCRGLSRTYRMTGRRLARSRKSSSGARRSNTETVRDSRPQNSSSRDVDLLRACSPAQTLISWSDWGSVWSAWLTSACLDRNPDGRIRWGGDETRISVI